MDSIYLVSDKVQLTGIKFGFLDRLRDSFLIIPDIKIQSIYHLEVQYDDELCSLTCCLAETQDQSLSRVYTVGYSVLLAGP